MNYAVEQRMRLIDFLLMHYGFVNRLHLTEFFGIGTAQATRDFKMYSELNETVSHNASSRRYEANSNFKAIFHNNQTDNNNHGN